MITDGLKTGADGSLVQLKEGVQSVVIDLESRHTIYAILIWHYLKEARAYADVVVQVSDDPDFIGNVVTLFNNDNSNQAGLGIGKGERICVLAQNNSAYLDLYGACAREGIVAYPINWRLTAEEVERVVERAAPLMMVVDASTLPVVTEWPELAQLDWSIVKERMRRPLVIDGRNFLPRTELLWRGFEYCGIGR